MEGTNLDCEQFKCCKLPHIKVWSQTKYARSHISPTLIYVRDLLHLMTSMISALCSVIEKVSNSICWQRRLNVCVSEESDLIDNTKFVNYKLFKYMMNCGN